MRKKGEMSIFLDGSPILFKDVLIYIKKYSYFLTENNHNKVS